MDQLGWDLGWVFESCWIGWDLGMYGIWDGILDRMGFGMGFWIGSDGIWYGLLDPSESKTESDVNRMCIHSYELNESTQKF